MLTTRPPPRLFLHLSFLFYKIQHAKNFSFLLFFFFTSSLPPPSSSSSKKCWFTAINSLSAQRRSKPLAKSEEILYNNEQLFHADSSVISFGESSRSVAIVVRINDTFIRGIRLSLIDTLLLLLLYNSLNFVIPPLFRFQNEKTPSRDLFYVYWRRRPLFSTWAGERQLWTLKKYLKMRTSVGINGEGLLL